MSKSNDGKYLEKKVQDAFKLLMKSLPIKMDRLQDAHAAGKFTANVSGDFLGCAKGVPWLVECKSSDMEESLRSCLSNAVSRPQTANHRLHIRAGGKSMFIFHSNAYDVLELWDGALVCQHHVAGKPLPKDGALLVTCLGDVTVALKEIML